MYSRYVLCSCYFSHPTYMLVFLSSIFSYIPSLLFTIICMFLVLFLLFFFFKQKTAYEMRISDWSSDVCSSDLHQRALGLADLADQQPVLAQVQRRIAQDLQHQVQAVVARTQAHVGLVGILLRQRVGLVVGHVGRVGDDQLVVPAGQAREQVRLEQLDVAGLQPRLVLRGQRQRVVGQVHRVHLPVRVVEIGSAHV